MLTIPLYDIQAPPDGWHHVIAPGGYEWWRFEAHDSTGLQLQLGFFDGDPFSNAYRLAYRRYRRRPTRVTPPVPRDYPCVRVVATDKKRGRRRDEGLAKIPYPAGGFCASADDMEIRIGPHSMRRRSDGAIQLTICAKFSIELMFRPLDSRHPELRQVASEQRSTTHFQVVNGPEYSVSGTVRGLEGNEQQNVIEGRGRTDHFYGTGPIDKGIEAFIARSLPPAE